MIDVFLSALPGEHATKQLMNIGSTQHLLTPLGLLHAFLSSSSFVRTKCTINVKQGVSDHPSGMYIDKKNTIVDLKEMTTVNFTFVSLGREKGINLGNSDMSKYLKCLSLYLQNCDEQNYAITAFTGCSKM